MFQVSIFKLSDDLWGESDFVFAKQNATWYICTLAINRNGKLSHSTYLQ